MKSFVAIQAFLLVIYLMGTNGRHMEHNDYEDVPEGEEQTELLNRAKDHATQARHRRRSRQMHGYDYSPPFYYDNRRDYNTRQQEEYLSRIVTGLDEIISYIRKPTPPPPQPIYIPYPVVQFLPCGSRPRPISGQKPGLNESSVQIPTFPDRFPIIEDENQLWGIPVEEDPSFDDGAGDGSRPINFIPAEPSRPTIRPPPSVEHGSNQAGNQQTTTAPPRRPGACETAILTCCSVQTRTGQRNCFARYNCLKTYSTNRACDPAVIKRVLEHFTDSYAPVKN